MMCEHIQSFNDKTHLWYVYFSCIFFFLGYFLAGTSEIYASNQVVFFLRKQVVP